MIVRTRLSPLCCDDNNHFEEHLSSPVLSKQEANACLGYSCTLPWPAAVLLNVLVTMVCHCRSPVLLRSDRERDHASTAQSIPGKIKFSRTR